MAATDFAPYLPYAGVLLALLFVVLGIRSGKRKRLVEALPTSKTTGVFIGLVELKGSAETDAPLTSYLADSSCVYYSYSILEKWSRTVTETYTDSDGKSQTRTRHESGWAPVGSGGERTLFYLVDDCGKILVRPNGAEMQGETVLNSICGPMDPLYYGKGPALPVPNSDFIRHFQEQAIPIHSKIYLMGQARERKDIVAPEIAEDKGVPMFLISTKSEEQIRSSFGNSFWLFLILGLGLSAGGFFARHEILGMDPARYIWHYVIAGTGYLFVAFIGWFWMVYNSLVDLRYRVRQAWSLVDIQLKRRHDLIPQLVETVKGFRTHEETLQTHLAELRGQMGATPPGEPGADYEACGPIIVALKESYPELKAQEAFLSLQKSLSDTEQRIALAREYFNTIATHYNLKLEVVPDRFIAPLAGIKPQALMAANHFERAPVEVNFAS